MCVCLTFKGKVTKFTSWKYKHLLNFAKCGASHITITNCLRSLTVLRNRSLAPAVPAQGAVYRLAHVHACQIWKKNLKKRIISLYHNKLFTQLNGATGPQSRFFFVNEAWGRLPTCPCPCVCNFEYKYYKINKKLYSSSTVLHKFLNKIDYINWTLYFITHIEVYTPTYVSGQYHFSIAITKITKYLLISIYSSLRFS